MTYYNETCYVPKFNTSARSYIYYLKVVYAKLSFVIVLVLSILLLTGYNKKWVINEKINMVVDTISKPCVYSVNVINNSSKFLFKLLENIIFVYKENNILKKQNEKLKEERLVILNLKYENENLKKLTNFIKSNEVSDYKTVKYNAITKNKYESKIRLNIGKNDNIKNNDIVVDKDGNLVGKTVRTTDDSTEVMLLTDIDSKIEAITLQNRVKLILNGSNSTYLDILYINDNEYKLLEGDSVFFMNNNPSLKEFYIGKIVKVNNEFKVKIGNNFNYIDYITIINQSSDIPYTKNNL